MADINQRIWLVVSRIPAGCVSTYGDVARQAGLGRGARRVGRALRALAPGSRVPWHRVVNARGEISLPAGSAGACRQRRQLMAEGVAFNARGRINLAQHRWTAGD